MRTIPKIALFTTLIVLLVSIIPVQGNGPPTCPKGSKIKVYPGGSIQSAVDAADPGDTIMVMPGVYHETVTISTDCLTLMGGWDGMDDDDGWAVLDGTGAGNAAFEIRADMVEIKGFEIRNYEDTEDAWGTGVDGWNDESDHCVVKKNYIHDMDSDGVIVASSGSSMKTGWSIKDNVIDTVGFGSIELYNCSDCEVKNNLLSSAFLCLVGGTQNDSMDSITMRNVEIKDNEMTRCSHAAVWIESQRGSESYMSDFTIASNNIHHSGGGIFSRDFSGCGEQASGFRVTGNIIVNQSKFGILLNRMDGVVVSGNWLEDIQNRGIVLIRGSSDNLITDNTVIGTGREGIFLQLPDPVCGVPHSNAVRDNTVVDAGTNGIGLVHGTHDNIVSDNQVIGSGSGCDLFWDGIGPGNCWKENTGTQCPDPLPGC